MALDSQGVLVGTETLLLQTCLLIIQVSGWVIIVIDLFFIGFRIWIRLTKGQRRLFPSDYVIIVAAVLKLIGGITTTIIIVYDLKGERQAVTLTQKMMPLTALSFADLVEYLKVCLHFF